MLGFSQFKQAYEEVMEEWAQINGSKISRGEFLEAIEGPWKKAFTAENIQKLFEVTGTWPVDWSKITPDKIAPPRRYKSRVNRGWKMRLVLCALPRVVVWNPLTLAHKHRQRPAARAPARLRAVTAAPPSCPQNQASFCMCNMDPGLSTINYSRWPVTQPDHSPSHSTLLMSRQPVKIHKCILTLY